MLLKADEALLPPGYEYSGEFRLPNKGDIFLTTPRQCRVAKATTFYYPYPILLPKEPHTITFTSTGANAQPGEYYQSFDTQHHMLKYQGLQPSDGIPGYTRTETGEASHG